MSSLEFYAAATRSMAPFGSSTNLHSLDTLIVEIRDNRGRPIPNLCFDKDKYEALIDQIKSFLPVTCRPKKPVYIRLDKMGEYSSIGGYLQRFNAIRSDAD